MSTPNTQEPCFYCRRGMHDSCISGDVACECCALSTPPDSRTPAGDA